MEDKCMEQILMLLEKSESRIDRTNEMLCKFTESAINLAKSTERNVEQIKDIIHEYTSQLERLQHQRDELTRHNGMLIEQQSKLLDALSRMVSVPSNSTTINNN